MQSISKLPMSCKNKIAYASVVQLFPRKWVDCKECFHWYHLAQCPRYRIDWDKTKQKLFKISQIKHHVYYEKNLTTENYSYFNLDHWQH